MIFTADSYELLSDATKARDDLPRLARQAELMVVDRYRAAEADGLTVQLRGWDDDPALLPDELRERLEMAIAAMIEHLATDDDGIKSVKRGSRAVTFSDSASGSPRSIEQLLAPFDERTPLYRI